MIVFGSDKPSHRLKDALHTRKPIGIIESWSLFLIEIGDQQVAFDGQTRKADADNGDTDELFAGKIDPFRKNAAHNGKPDRAGSISEFREEGFTLRLNHICPLREDRQTRGDKLLVKFIEIGEGWAVNEIVAGVLAKMAPNGLNDFVD